MKLIEDFNVEGIDRTQITRDWYAARLSRFFDFIAAEHTPLAAVGPATINRFLTSLQTYSWSTRNGSYTALNAFFKWAKLRGHIKDNPFDLEPIKRPRKPRRIRQPLPLARVQTILDTMAKYDDIMARRDCALLLVTLDAGLRRMEAVGLNVGNVNLQTGQVAVLVAKGDNQRWTQIEPPTIRVVNRWLAVHPSPKARAPLFTVGNGKRLSARRVNGIFCKWSQRAGVEPHITPHDLRRLFATYFSHSGGSSKILQSLLGHENLETTEGYILNSEDEIRLQHKRHSPVNALKMAK